MAMTPMFDEIYIFVTTIELRTSVIRIVSNERCKVSVKADGRYMSNETIDVKTIDFYQTLVSWIKILYKCMWFRIHHLLLLLNKFFFYFNLFCHSQVSNSTTFRFLYFYLCVLVSLFVREWNHLHQFHLLHPSIFRLQFSYSHCMI